MKNMKINIGISEKNLTHIVATLTVVLADEMTLYVKTRKFHWNVTGESFMEMHKLYEGQYKQLEEIIDAVAERINQLGSKTIGTLSEFAKHTSVKESPGKYHNSKDMILELLKDYEMVIQSLRKNINKCAGIFKDAGSADFLTGVMEQHEKSAWILRRYLS